MKKIFQLGTIFFGLMFIQNGYAADYGSYQGSYQGQGEIAGDQGSCPQDHPCEDQKLNECWCLYCHYEPQQYTVKRCVQEQVPCTKKCTRMVPKYYEVQRCKYVPQYYTETLCKQEVECYEEPDTKCVTREVCETKCKYVPRYYWKHVCGNDQCAAQQPCCN